MRVCVIGAGIAGTAATWVLAREGVEVICFGAQGGASALYSGALDDSRAAPQRAAELLEPDVMLFGADLGAWSFRSDPCRVVTSTGGVRSARGSDVALLDLEPLAGKRVAVADVAREDWDAPLLASALARSAWAQQTGTRFEVVRVDLLQHSYERRIPLYDFATLFEQASRAEHLNAALRRATAGQHGWLLGPWLGTNPELAERLRQVLELAVGETLSPPGGPAGARFENARDRMFSSLGVLLHTVKVSRLEPRFSGWTVFFQRDDAAPATSETMEADAVVLASGGVAAGGIHLLPLEPGQRAAPGLALSLKAPVSFQLDGYVFDRDSSLHGIDFKARGVRALERLGVAADGPRATGQTGLYVAGDLIADRPRTAVDAARSGIVAARALLASARRVSRPPPARRSSGF